MNPKTSPAYRFKSIHSLFIVGIILLIAVVSLPLFFSGVIIINNITSTFGNEILTEELNSLIEPINLRYKTLERVGLEDSLTHIKEIKENAILDLSRYRYKQTGTAFVLKKNGNIIISSDFDDQNAQNFATFFSQIKQNQDMVKYLAKTKNRIGVTTYYPAWDAYIGISMDRHELFAPRNLFIQINIIVLLMLLFIASLCALAIHHFIISPILRLTHYAEQISKGDLQSEIPGTFILELAEVKKDIMGMVASLVSREKKYRAIFNAPSDAIVLHDAATGEILEANMAIHTMYGYTSEEFLTKNMGDISSGHHPYTMEEAGKRMNQLSQHNHLRFEWHSKKKNGELFWVDVSLRPLLHEGKQCVLAVVRDIDSKKKDAEDLAAEKEQLAITLRSIGDGVITTDNHGLVVLINKVAEELTGWSQQEAAGQSLDKVLQLVHSRDDTPIPNPAREVLSSGFHGGFPEDTTLVARDGTRREIADSAAPIFDIASKIVGVVLVFRDVTEKQRLEKEILKIKKIESVGILAGGIAHDFNNLLSAILGNINLARIKLEPDCHPGNLLKEAEKAALRARHLTQQLLTFSKGGEPLRETADLAEIIHDNVGFVLRGSQTHYDIDVPDDLWQVAIDPGQIGQVIQNIVINSRQAMDTTGGHITITAENCADCTEPGLLTEKCVNVTIKDNGPGIPLNILEKVFDPYFTTKQDGSGLGLAICHSIIQKHNGTLLVHSEPEKGVVFTLKLPVAQKINSLQGIAPKVKTNQNKNLKILVMDDEKMLLNVAFEMLNALGHQVKTATDGAEALTLYQEALEQGIPFDTVILDLTIPGGMGGKEACTKLLELHPQAKIIVTSGYSNDPVMANYQEYGFVAILAKPFFLQDLKKVLEII